MPAERINLNNILTINFYKGMKLKSFLTLVLAALTVVVSAQSLSPSTKWHWDKGTIVVETPERPAGQQHVIGLTVPDNPVDTLG